MRLHFRTNYDTNEFVSITFYSEPNSQFPTDSDFKILLSFSFVVGNDLAGLLLISSASCVRFLGSLGQARCKGNSKIDRWKKTEDVICRCSIDRFRFLPSPEWRFWPRGAFCAICSPDRAWNTGQRGGRGWEGVLRCLGHLDRKIIFLISDHTCWYQS